MFNGCGKLPQVHYSTGAMSTFTGARLSEGILDGESAAILEVRAEVGVVLGIAATNDERGHKFLTGLLQDIFNYVTAGYNVELERYLKAVESNSHLARVYKRATIANRETKLTAERYYYGYLHNSGDNAETLLLMEYKGKDTFIYHEGSQNVWFASGVPKGSGITYSYQVGVLTYEQIQANLNLRVYEMLGVSNFVNFTEVLLELYMLEKNRIYPMVEVEASIYATLR